MKLTFAFVYVCVCVHVYVWMCVHATKFIDTDPNINLKRDILCVLDQS